MAGHPKALDVSEGDLLPYFGRGFLEYLAEDVPEGSRVLLKQPSVESIHWVFGFFPPARVILISRDGRDIACSAMNTTFAVPPRLKWRHPGTYRFFGKNPLNLMAERWAKASRTVRAFFHQLDKTGFRDQVKVLRYEDLVKEPGEVPRLLLQFLDLPEEGLVWTDLDQLPVRGSSFIGNAAESSLDWTPGDVGARDLGSVGRWHTWSEHYRRSLQRIAGEELRFWGYDEGSGGVVSPELGAWTVGT